MKSNIHKKLTKEDKFARKYHRKHARLAQIRSEKKQQHRKFRQLSKDTEGYYE